MNLKAKGKQNKRKEESELKHIKHLPSIQFDLSGKMNNDENEKPQIKV